MSQVGLQNQDVLNVINRFTPTDPNLSIPSIDPSILTAVLNVNPEWVNLDRFTMFSGTVSINGAGAVIDDNDATSWSGSFPTGEFPSIQQNRVETWHVTVAGGTVTPITCSFAWRQQGVATMVQASGTVTNPGRMMFGPFVIPFGFAGRLFTTAGGVGDTISVNVTGFQAPQGVPLPALGGPFIRVE